MNVLKHERFERVPMQPQKRRRGPLPRGVVSINYTPRLRVGALVEIVGLIKGAQDNGKRVRIRDFDYRDACSVEVESPGNPLSCDDGSISTKLWMKPANLRRLWTGLSETERLQLRLRRAS